MPSRPLCVLSVEPVSHQHHHIESDVYVCVCVDMANLVTNGPSTMAVSHGPRRKNHALCLHSQPLRSAGISPWSDSIDPWKTISKTHLSMSQVMRKLTCSHPCLSNSHLQGWHAKIMRLQREDSPFTTTSSKTNIKVEKLAG